MFLVTTVMAMSLWRPDKTLLSTSSWRLNRNERSRSPGRSRQIVGRTGASRTGVLGGRAVVLPGVAVSNILA
jgi:hypothetical protein